MADRNDFYFRQKVTEAELDGAFDKLEQADWDLVVDQGFEGIVSGLGVTEDSPASLDVLVAAGVAYDKDGKRISVGSQQTVDLSEDDAAASTAVATPGNEKWISLFVVFDRLLSDSRTDGNSATVFFDRAESFSFSVVQSAEAGSGAAVKPSLDPAKILLCDVLMTNGKTTILNADINTDRRESRTFPLSSASYGGGATWADGTTNPATDVESQLDKIIDDLGQSNQGANRILSAAIAGSPTNITQAGINNQLAQLLSALNVHLNSSAAHAPADVGAVALSAADIITAIKSMGVGGILRGAAAKNLDEALIDDLRDVTSDAALILETNSQTSGMKIRVYVGDTNVRGGLQITMNAAWDPATNEWVSDAAGTAIKVSLTFQTSPLSVSRHSAAAGGERWTDNSSGWDDFEQMTLTMSAGGTDLALTNDGTLTLAGNAPATPSTGRLYRDNIVKAWGSVSTNGNPGIANLDSSYRCASAQVLGNGHIEVTLDPAMSNANYAVVVTGEGSDRFNYVIDNRTTTTFEIAVYQTATDVSLDLNSEIVTACFIVCGID